MSTAPGWYGKIPSLGDFASRRLPPDFIGTWDSWLQHSMAASRATLGDRWLDIYLTSPIWRFALMPGALDASAWAGLLMPSVDKVGRHFPLTFAVDLSLARHRDTATLILTAEPWFSALEKIALSALDIDSSVDDLERELTQLPFPVAQDLVAAESETTAKLAQWWLDPSAASQAIQLPADRSPLELLTTMAQHVVVATSVGKTIWWAKAGDSPATDLNLFAGMPPEDYFAQLLLGNEWRDQPAVA